jgi:hypothetical protein
MPELDTLQRCYELLGISPTASDAEVATAYRDLVKVWHPDRFQHEPPRLQALAQEKLKSINLAYEQIQKSRPRAGRKSTRSAAQQTQQHKDHHYRAPSGDPPPGNSRDSNTAATREKSTVRKAPHTSSSIRVWLIVVAGVVLLRGFIAVVGADRYTTQPPEPTQVGDGSSGSGVPAANKLPEATTSTWQSPEPKTSEPKELKSDGLSPGPDRQRPAPLSTVQNTPDASDSPAGASPASSDLVLQDLDSDQQASIESVCGYDKYVKGPVAYDRCVKRHLGALNKHANQQLPDLDPLSSDERASIESVCGYDKYVTGPVAYDRCLRRQLALLKASPRAPALSGLSSNERASIESVCGYDKYVRGPVAYHRCLTRQLEALKKYKGE